MNQQIQLDTGKYWLSERDALLYTSLSRQTLNQARSDGKLTYRQFGRKILYTRQDLDNYINQNSQLVLSNEDYYKRKGAK